MDVSLSSDSTATSAEASVDPRLADRLRRLRLATSRLDQDAEAGSEVDALLTELRLLWRECPQIFAEEHLRALRAVAALRPRTNLPVNVRPGRTPADGAMTTRGTPALAGQPTSPPSPQAARDVLTRIWGYPSFRPGQEEIIRAVLAGRDCVGIMPTGAGKSLTYQIPARVLGGTTLVISPLIALMKDQVDALTEVGFRATYLNSSLSLDERRERVRALWRGEMELVYAAPEGLEASVGEAIRRARLSLIAVDEAHCISHWGHDFRPAYRNLAGLKARFGQVPVLALTATATPEVMNDIIAQLGMRAPMTFKGPFFRPNLLLGAHRKGEGDGSVRDHLLRFALARRGSSGIVYCLSRKATEQTASFLAEHGISAAPYHAGLDPAERARVQDAFRRDDIEVVVATVAFGMGIDKPNIRYVVHRDMPRSPESYYQEIGRAGRDGLPSHCMLFYSWADVLAHDRILDNSEGTGDLIAKQRAQVRTMFRLADGRTCRHRAIVAHFGEAGDACGTSCDVCTSAASLFQATNPVATKRPGRAKDPVRRAKPDVDPATPSADGDSALYELLRALRRRLAETRGIPAFLVFSDATLVDLVAKHPLDEEALLEVQGIGPKKVAQYGEALLAALREAAETGT